jgi:hypothetical protein
MPCEALFLIAFEKDVLQTKTAPHHLQNAKPPSPDGSGILFYAFFKHKKDRAYSRK